MKLQKLIFGLLALVLAVSLAACGASGKASSAQSSSEAIKIAYLPITHALDLFATKEALEAQSGQTVELVKYGSWPELLDALNTGRVDGASVLIELAMKSKQNGIGITAVALGHKDGNVIVVSNDIQSAQDMKGKEFAIPHRQSSHNILLHDALEKAGLTEDDIEITELAPTEMPSALASGQIDGYCVAEPFGAKAVTMGVGHVLYTSEELWPDSLCCALVLNDDFLKNEPDKAASFVKAYKQAGKDLHGDKAEQLAEKYLGQDQEVLVQSLEWITFDDLDITEETYADLLQKVKEYGLSDNPPSYEEFVNNIQ